jgi:hypothetical protein
MGWRADVAREQHDRAEWRAFLARQPWWRRVAIIIISALPFVAMVFLVVAAFGGFSISEH